MKIKALLGTVVFTAKKFSPEICMGLGLCGFAGTAVLVGKATLKCEAVIDEYREKEMQIHEACELNETGDVDYSEQTALQDRVANKANLGLGFIKLYGPAFSLFLLSTGLVLGSHRIMKRRNVALMAAYKLVETTFQQYRDRVVSELGEEKDQHFRYGTSLTDSEETVMIDGKEETRTVQKQNLQGVSNSMYSRVFEDQTPDQHGGWTGTSQWCPVHDYNILFIEARQQTFQDKLIAKGFVTLNEVLEELGFPTTMSGMVVGWKYKGDGDNYISFRPKNDSSWIYGKDGDPILLEFNVDGVIFDDNKARREIL